MTGGGGGVNKPRRHSLGGRTYRVHSVESALMFIRTSDQATAWVRVPYGTQLDWLTGEDLDTYILRAYATPPRVR